MKVTYVELSFPTEKDRMPPDFRCWAKVTIDGIIVISEIKLIERENKTTNEIERFIRLPSRRSRVYTGEFVYTSIINIKDDELRYHITEEISKKYEKLTSRNNKNNEE